VPKVCFVNYFLLILQTFQTVQCYNRGFDGLDVQWECQAQLPIEYQFGRISVSCEGYDSPKDPYVLAGSCGLEYELDYSSTGSRKAAFSSPDDIGINWTYIMYFVIIAFVFYLLYLTLTSPREGGEGDRFRSGGGGYPGDGPGGNDRRPPHPPGNFQVYNFGIVFLGWRPPPPSYDETFKNTGNTGSTSSSSWQQPGFFSGLGLGALGGYFMGNRGSGNQWWG
jgi:hypothetical protein